MSAKNPKGAKVQRCKGAGFVHLWWSSLRELRKKLNPLGCTNPAPLHLCTFAPLGFYPGETVARPLPPASRTIWRALHHTRQHGRPILGPGRGPGCGHCRGRGRRGLRTLAELALCPRDFLYGTLLRVPGATADVPVAEPAKLDKALALGAFNARPIGLSAGRFC